MALIFQGNRWSAHCGFNNHLLCADVPFNDRDYLCNFIFWLSFISSVTVPLEGHIKYPRASQLNSVSLTRLMECYSTISIDYMCFSACECCNCISHCKYSGDRTWLLCYWEWLKLTLSLQIYQETQGISYHRQHAKREPALRHHTLSIPKVTRG